MLKYVVVHSTWRMRHARRLYFIHCSFNQIKSPPNLNTRLTTHGDGNGVRNNAKAYRVVDETTMDENAQ